MSKQIKLWGLLVLVLLVLPLLQNIPVRADTTAPSGTDVIFDADCQRLILTGGNLTSDGKPACNINCQRQILYDGPDFATKNGQFCSYGSTSVKGSINNSNYLPDAKYPIGKSQPDSFMIYIRGALIAVLGITGLGVILLGLYGWYLRAMSEGNPEKIEESVKVYKNAIIGAIIVASSALIVQMIFIFIGVTDSVFDFNFIPKYGYTVQVTDNDAGRYCFSSQVDKDSTGGSYKCVDNRWVKQ